MATWSVPERGGISEVERPVVSFAKRGTREGGWFWPSRATPLVPYFFFITGIPVERIKFNKIGQGGVRQTSYVEENQVP